jgi:hypothetical protein
MGTDQDLIFRIRDRQRGGRPSAIGVFTAGQGFILKGGYGGIAGVNQGVSSANEVTEAVAIQARKKVDGLTTVLSHVLPQILHEGIPLYARHFHILRDAAPSQSSACTAVIFRMLRVAILVWASNRFCN